MRTSFRKLNSVPPEYATVSGLPWSWTWKIPEIVPGVWPGIRYIVSVLPPSVIFMTSVAIMSRLGLPFGKPLTDWSTISQSPARKVNTWARFRRRGLR